MAHLKKNPTTKKTKENKTKNKSEKYIFMHKKKQNRLLFISKCKKMCKPKFCSSIDIIFQCKFFKIRLFLLLTRRINNKIMPATQLRMHEKKNGKLINWSLDGIGNHSCEAPQHLCDSLCLIIMDALLCSYYLENTEL